MYGTSGHVVHAIYTTYVHAVQAVWGVLTGRLYDVRVEVLTHVLHMKAVLTGFWTLQNPQVPTTLETVLRGAKAPCTPVPHHWQHRVSCIRCRNLVVAILIAYSCNCYNYTTLVVLLLSVVVVLLIELLTAIILKLVAIILVVRNVVSDEAVLHIEAVAKTILKPPIVVEAALRKQKRNWEATHKREDFQPKQTNQLVFSRRCQLTLT